MSIPCTLRAAALLAAAAAAAPSCAFADGGGAAAPAPAHAPAANAAAPTPRYTALEQEIRHLERHLAALRKARSELAAGRSEPVPLDEAARRDRESQARALREVQRYEAARAKAVSQYVEASSPGKDGATDEAKATEARTAVEQVDRAFLAAIAKVDAPPPEPKSDAAKKPAVGGDDASKSAPADAPKRSRTKKVADGDGDGDGANDEG